MSDLSWTNADSPDIARFWSQLEARGADECWPWMKRRRNGYGYFEHAGHRVSAHRFAWELANRQGVPSGRMVCHHCDNRICCNPAHLFVGTAADNNHDMMRKGRARFVAAPPRGEGNGSAKLDAETVRHIRISRLPNTVLARELGVAHSTVARVRRGETWTHV